MTTPEQQILNLTAALASASEFIKSGRIQAALHHIDNALAAHRYSLSSVEQLIANDLGEVVTRQLVAGVPTVQGNGLPFLLEAHDPDTYIGKIKDGIFTPRDPDGAA